jgi:hypothetical protein
MTVWTLLGVKIFGHDAEHVVTLCANAMQSRLPRRRSLVFGGMNLWLCCFRTHDASLA